MNFSVCSSPGALDGILAGELGQRRLNAGGQRPQRSVDGRGKPHLHADGQGPPHLRVDGQGRRV
jgi:hypothetical protein